MNAADYYGLEELKRACNGFVQQGCITVDTVCALLSSAERYIHFKCTKSLVQRVLEFVDEHGKIDQKCIERDCKWIFIGTEVLNLGSFTLLPQHVVRLILGMHTNFWKQKLFKPRTCCSTRGVASRRIYKVSSGFNVEQEVLRFQSGENACQA